MKYEHAAYRKISKRHYKTFKLFEKRVTINTFDWSVIETCCREPEGID